MSDVIETFADFRRGFLAMGIEPPEYIILKSRHDGMSLMQTFDPKNFVVTTDGPTKIVTWTNGRSYIQAEVTGVKVLWPVH